MKVPFIDLKAQYQSIKTEIDTAISNVISETAFIGGKYVEDFEYEFAKLYGVKHCIGVGNGTDSLYIIMKMLGIGSGDEVITTAHSWISSSETISQTGANVVFVDTDSEHFVINAELIESKITSKTKAIMPVHLYGQMCNMDKIVAICKKHRLYLIEDCAQSHFSEWKGKRAGTFGIAGSFSFYPGKNLGAYGDAGCIITNDDELAIKCKMYARHGGLKKHQHTIEGINSRLDGLQAAILNVKLKYILDWTSSRISNAAYYDEILRNITQITTPKRFENTLHTYHLYVIKAENRDGLSAFLKSKGIDTAIHYPIALPELEAYENIKQPAIDFVQAVENQKKILSIPMFPELKKEMMDFIGMSIREFYQN